MQTHHDTSTHPASTATEKARRIQYAQAWEPQQKRHSDVTLLVPVVMLSLLIALAAIAFVSTAAEPDRRSEWAKAERLLAEQKAAAAAERRQRAAQAMCSSDHGPQVLAIWTSSGSVECVNARGRRLSLSSSRPDSIHASR